MNRLAGFLVVIALCMSGNAAAEPIRIRGSADLRARIETPRDTLIVRGRLQDELGKGLNAARISLSTSPPLADPKACEAARRRARPDPLLTGTDGAFCLRFKPTARRGRVRLSFPGDLYHGSSKLKLDYDLDSPSRLATRLEFEPPPRSLDLDSPTSTITARLGLSRRAAYADRAGHNIVLHDADNKVLATAKTGGDGRVRLTVARPRFGPPGRGLLRLSFEGDKLLKSATTQLMVSRRAKSVVEIIAAPASLEKGVRARLDLRLTAAGTPIDGGVVELRSLEGTSVASASVNGGRAKLEFRLGTLSVPRVSFDIVYQSSAPWITPGSPTRWSAPLDQPHWVRWLLLGGALLSSLLLVTFTWRRSRRQPAAVPIVEPGIFVVESPTSPGEKGENAWRGYVRDAHDPSARPTVSIRLYRPAVNEQDALLIETRCSSEGVFEFKLDKPAPDGATIEAMAPGYTMERRRLPPPGSLKVHLSTRRRSVITRFTAWARRQIATSGLSEPTPQDVAKRHVGDSNVETWAQDVDHAAFGPTAPNAEVEFELHNRAPGRAPSRAASTIKASKSQIDPQIGGKAPPSTSS